MVVIVYHNNGNVTASASAGRAVKPEDQELLISHPGPHSKFKAREEKGRREKEGRRKEKIIREGDRDG